MKKRNLSGVLVLLVFAVFMVSVLLVLLSGADTVQRLSERDQKTYHHRTAVQYISTRIRQADSRGAVKTEIFDNLSSLVLTEYIDSEPYETRIYCCDGYLREMFCSAGAALPPEFGEKILPMDGFAAAKESDTLKIVLSLPDGSSEEIFLVLRSEGGSVS